ncbi:hypothetical protein [uncultured Mediterranean phage]|nr:hypothetical protein [uncultured Mediterranean phage]
MKRKSMKRKSMKRKTMKRKTMKRKTMRKLKRGGSDPPHYSEYTERKRPITMLIDEVIAANLPDYTRQRLNLKTRRAGIDRLIDFAKESGYEGSDFYSFHAEFDHGNTVSNLKVFILDLYKSGTIRYEDLIQELTALK